jgi:hypothetical protein
MRKTGLFGCNKKDYIEWPTNNDLLQMVKNIPIKFQDLRYKNSSSHTNLFGAFQVILSNGISSPVFNSKSTNDQNM